MNHLARPELPKAFFGSSIWAICFSIVGAACAASGSATPDAGSPAGASGSATGGASSVGGRDGSTSGAGGGTSLGGSPARGGTTGAAGAAAAGGATGTGGAAGGVTGAGGAAARGGVSGSGGSGGAAAAGASGSAGQSGAGGVGHGGSNGGGGTAAGGAPAFNPCPAAGTPCIVMPLGDSITDGVGSPAPGGGYRVQLFHDAVQAGKALTFVGSATDPNGPTTLDGKMFPRNHEGHPGYTIDDSATTSGISPLVDSSIAANHPQIILLMIGTNDVNRNIDVANAPARLGALLDRMIKDAPNALLVVAKITPWMDDGANATVVQTYNNAIAGVVQTRAASGKHVVAVDMFAAFTANPNYQTALMSDFLHPNGAGYVVMGDVWFAAIHSYLPAAP